MTSSVRWICHGDSKSLAYCVGNVLCSLLQLSATKDDIVVLLEEETKDSSKSRMSPPKVEITKNNCWTENSESITTTSWWDSFNEFLQHGSSLSQSSQLLGVVDQSGSSNTTVQQWIEQTVQMLTSVVDNDASIDPILSLFFQNLEETLISQPNSFFINGNSTPTIADIFIAIVYYHLSTSIVLPSKCQSMVQSILDHPKIKAHLPPMENAKQDSANTEFQDNAVIQQLRQWNLEHSVYSHPTCVTAEELVQTVPLPDPSTHTHTKNLVLQDKKHGTYLLTLHPDTKVQTKELGALLQLTGKTNFRMASSDLLEEHLHCRPGTVGPLAIAMDTKRQIPTILIDQKLLSYAYIHSHPLQNDASVILTPDVLMDYLNRTEHDVKTMDFSSSVQATSTGAKQSKSSSSATTTTKVNKDKKSVEKGKTLLAVGFKKEENFSMWYSDVITLAEMISYYDISGCYILRPWSYQMWEFIQNWFNHEIALLDVENCYFPLFVTKDRLEKEKDHVEGFAPEVAWVTKSGDGDLAKPIAIRPTSETIMYPAFSDWIQSHRDLPLKLNQWSNVVRWEFKYPTPFLRSREFLWQEGHTAHATHADADVMVRQALELYRRVYEELLAVPVIPGYKTEEEKFAGGLQTTTVEAYVPVAGRAIQGATSHNLGQNFGKMFDITFQNQEGKTEIAWQTSWGLTTRTIGVMVMVHGDNTGLVLPPRISPLQCVIVPITSKTVTMEMISVYCQAIANDLKEHGIRCKFDDRTLYNPGWKYNHWEQKGVPIRIEVGPRDMEEQKVCTVIRYNGEKASLPVAGLGATLVTKLDEIQAGLLQRATQFRDDHLVQVTDWKDFVPNLERHNLVLTPWCGGEHKDWEEYVKNKSREESLAASGQAEEDARTATSVAAKTLCIPFDQPPLPPGTKCFASGLDATCWVLWGRSY